MEFREGLYELYCITRTIFKICQQLTRTEYSTNTGERIKGVYWMKFDDN